jgi:predicted Zn finger-like uncharacterized protein
MKMIVACPTCKARFKIDEARIKPPGVRLRCAKCQNLFAVRKRVVEAAPSSPPALASPPPCPSPPGPSGPKPKVLVAHGDPDYCAVMTEALQEGGYQVLTAHDGVEALLQIQRGRPTAVVLEASLPKMYGFEICEFMKRSESLQHIKVLLTVSENGRNRYRRDPQSTYGADDFIEERRFREDLLRKVSAILSGPEPASGGAPEIPVPSPEPVSVREKAEEAPTAREAPTPEFERPPEPVSVREKTEEAPTAREAPTPEFEPPADREVAEPDDPTEKAREKARRLARIIVSDIALYNEGVIDKGIRSGQLMNLIRDDLEEGYRLFRSRVPQDVAEETDYIREALKSLVERKRAALRGKAVEAIDAKQGEEKPLTSHRAPQPVEEGFGDDDF